MSKLQYEAAILPEEENAVSGPQQTSMQAAGMTIVKVALDVPLDRYFDYLGEARAPETTTPETSTPQASSPQVSSPQVSSPQVSTLAVGQRVVVGFGRRQQVGIVMGLSTYSDVPLEKLKPIQQAYPDETALDAEVMDLLKFSAEYYQYPYGQALLSALPARLRQTKPAVARKQYGYALTEFGRQQGWAALPVKKTLQRSLMAALSDVARGAVITASALGAISAGWRKPMQQLMLAGLVEAHEVIAGVASSEVTIADQKNGLGLPHSLTPQIAESIQASNASFKGPTLNEEQAAAVAAILADPGCFKPWLLHGITGSGKTEVYIRLLQSMLENNAGQALVLVPEINLTPQLEARFRSRLPNFPLVSLHSNLSESERLQHWRMAQSGVARIVIGTRLAVFTPLKQLLLVIVDEEHDGSYKQQDGMRYHARDVAMVRAQRNQVPIVLGSATPALETWHNATAVEPGSRKFGLLSLNQRAVSKAMLPLIRCVDTTKNVPEHGLTLPLLNAMQDRLDKGEQSLLFINRRGYSPVLLCSSCHWIAPCSRCSAKLVVHLKQGRLRCHHCGLEEKIVRACPSCGNQDLHATGHGTQRLEETLAARFPGARILRVDRDSTRSKHALTDMLDAVHANKVDILVGTQMLAKGHDFPNLTLVGVVDSDSALFSPDFRAAERLFAQLMQVAGRAGRAEKAGEVLIQTAFPDHVLFNALRAQDYTAYAHALLQERAMTEFPPCSFMALLRAEANDYSLVAKFLGEAAEIARHWDRPNILIYDPVRPQMERLKGMERGQLLLQAGSRQTLQGLLRNWLPLLRANKAGAKVRWAIDVDPLEF